MGLARQRYAVRCKIGPSIPKMVQTRSACVSTRCYRSSNARRCIPKKQFKEVNPNDVVAPQDFDRLCTKHFPELARAVLHKGKICCERKRANESVRDVLAHDLNLMAHVIRKNSELEPVRKTLVKRRAKHAASPKAGGKSIRESIADLTTSTIEFVKELLGAISISVKVFSKKHPRAFFAFVACVCIYYMAPVGAAEGVITIATKMVGLYERFMASFNYFEWQRWTRDITTSMWNYFGSSSGSKKVAASVVKTAVGASTTSTGGMVTRSMLAGVSSLGLGAGMALAAPLGLVLPALQFAAGDIDIVDWMFM